MLVISFVKDMKFGYFFYFFNLLLEGLYFMNVKIMILNNVYVISRIVIDKFMYFNINK